MKQNVKQTWMLFRDEFQGAVKSWVPIVLWIGFPLLGVGIYYLVQVIQEAAAAKGGFEPGMMPQQSMASFVQMVVTSTAAQLAGILVCVEIVNEKTRKVYDLFAIRPLKPGNILWAKFFSVFLMVVITLMITILASFLIDFLRGDTIFWSEVQVAMSSFVTNIGLIGVATALGVIMGTISPTVLIGVLILLFGAGNLAIIPVLPVLLGGEELTWLSNLISLALTLLLMYGSASIFNKKEF